eukprot:2071309-Amphidinium_carterae.1
MFRALETLNASGAGWHRIGYTMPTLASGEVGASVTTDNAFIADRQFALLLRMCAHRLRWVCSMNTRCHTPS